jgi:DNA helicase-2/ATP-dependent DNA helicase PcrA
MFKRDFLLFDIEATGIDVTRHEMIQLAAVLLDKKTLKEKASFTSYIRPKKWKQRSREAMAVNKISWATLADAPNMKSVLKSFTGMFPKNVTMAHYGGMIDVPFLANAFREQKMKYPYDYHVFDLWPVFYVYMAKHKKLTDPSRAPGFSLESISRLFKVKVEGSRHDALTDCRIEAEVLRHVLKASKKTSRR